MSGFRKQNKHKRLDHAQNIFKTMFAINGNPTRDRQRYANTYRK